MSQLRVIIDGHPLPEPDARALWNRFSAHMDQHQGDFEGFARAEGFAEASVAVSGGTPTLSLKSAETSGAQPPAEGARSAGAATGGGGSRRRRRRKRDRGRKHQAPRRQAPRDDGSSGNEPPHRRPPGKDAGGSKGGGEGDRGA